MHTTTRELYLEDAPEIFELKAQDETGNDFSVLEGVKFDWKIDRPQILRFLTFTESKYHQVSIEKAGQFHHIEKIVYFCHNDLMFT